MRSKQSGVVIAFLAIVALVSIATARAARAVYRTARGPNAAMAPASQVVSKKPSRVRTKRFHVALVFLSLAAVASTSVGVTLALYSNKPTGETNTFVAGTVSVANVVTGACAASTNNMAPADTATCTLATTYGGSLSGYMAVDVFIAAQKNTTAGGASATDLYNPADTTNEAQITVNSTTPTVTYVVAGGSPTSFGTAITCPGAGTSLDGNSYTTFDKCYLLSNLLVAATAFSSGTVTFTTGITLPSTQPNTYQGSSTVVVLAAHAVQSKNNLINCTAGGTSPTAGAVCTPTGSFAWS